MKKSILMLASLALLSACNKESNEPVVQQEQKANDGLSISISGQIDLPEEMARGLEFQAFPGKNGGTSYAPYFHSGSIPALVCFYNEDGRTDVETPYVMREISLDVTSLKGADGRWHSTFSFKTNEGRDARGHFQDHLKMNPGDHRDTKRVNTDPELLRMALVVGFETYALKETDNWGKAAITPSETSYNIGQEMDLSKNIDYWVSKDDNSTITRPIFTAYQVRSSGVGEGKIGFSNVKLRMLGSIIKAKITNEQFSSNKVLGLQVDGVGRGNLVFEAPVRSAFRKTKGQLIHPVVAQNSGGGSEQLVKIMFSESAQKELAQDQSYEVTVYLPLNKTESDGRIDGPTFHVIYEDRNGEQKTTAGKYLKPLNRDGLVVSHEFKIK
ncbi:hypothetical protein [uncultured Porphyromonas sp.]|uniref:hypothetical protein n=1 Tax=uncultured Porphyromonas sp. TaxID=159274 RepID=UPI00262FBFEF|nr:hypothetical protein [uncultured Porphyromonas sp.]